MSSRMGYVAKLSRNDSFSKNKIETYNEIGLRILSMKLLIGLVLYVCVPIFHTHGIHIHIY